MIDKCELLQSVKKSVEENGIIESEYSDGEKCCVVGHALLAMGMTTDELIELKSQSVDNIFNNTNTPDYIIPFEIFEKAHFLVVESGIGVEEWSKLQTRNDLGHEDDVLEFLEEMIVSNNC